MAHIFFKWLREPLLHFLLIGAGLFLVYDHFSKPDTGRDNRIVISQADLERLNYFWQRRWIRSPTQEEFLGMLEDHVREEILFREALKLGLDQGDTIIRRRLAQKMDFLSNDLAAQAEPTGEELAAFLAENQDRFQEPARFTFSHIYLSPDERGERVVSDAEALLDQVRRDPGSVKPSAAGDPIMLQDRYTEIRKEEVENLFGKEFAERISGLNPGKWQGPVESGYGVHLVRVDERNDPRLPPLSEIGDAVRVEFVIARQRQANEDFYRRLRQNYEVIIEEETGGLPQEDTAEDSP